MVGEVHLDVDRIAEYYGSGDMLHMVFNFAFTEAPWSGEAWMTIIAEAEAALSFPHAWPVWVFSSHDASRHRSRFGGDERRARLAALVLLTLRGTPFLYAGEELGLLDLQLPPALITDPHGRERSRAPIPWDDSPRHGWGHDDPWLPFPPESAQRNVRVLSGDPASILHLYRQLLTTRRGSAALQGGTLRLLEAPKDLLVYERSQDRDRRTIVANFSDLPATFSLDGEWTMEASSISSARAGEQWRGQVEGTEAVLLRPTA